MKLIEQQQQQHKKAADEVTFICSKFVNCLSVNFPFYMHFQFYSTKLYQQ